MAIAIFLWAVSLEPSPILRALPKSTSPARKDRKVGLDKLCLLMEALQLVSLRVPKPWLNC